MVLSLPWVLICGFGSALGGKSPGVSSCRREDLHGHLPGRRTIPSPLEGTVGSGPGSHMYIQMCVFTYCGLVIPLRVTP